MPSPKTLSAINTFLQAQKKGEEDMLLSRLVKALEMMGRMEGYKGEKGEPGIPGYTPRKGVDYYTEQELREILKAATPIKGVHYFDGDKGDDGRDGIDGIDGVDGVDGIANMDEVEKEIKERMNEHTQEFNHSLLHDQKMVGKYEIEGDIKDGELLQVKGGKIVGTNIQMPDINGLRMWVASQGVSNVRSYPVTSSRELEPFILWIVDATAGNLTLTIPSASGMENAWFEMIRIDPTSNIVTIQPTGSETFSGQSSYLLQQFTDLQLFAYNGSYLIRQAT